MNGEMVGVIVGLFVAAIPLLERVFNLKDEASPIKRKRAAWFVGAGFLIIIITGPIQVCNQLQKEEDTKTAKDQHNTDDSLAVQTDTDVKSQGKETRNSLTAEASRLRDSLSKIQARLNSMASKQPPKTRPDIDIFPLQGELNPQIKKRLGDTLNIKIEFANNGTESAIDMHFMYNIVISRNGILFLDKSNLSLDAYKGVTFPNIKNYTRTESLTYYNNQLIATDTVFLCSIFCYKNSRNERDTLKRRMFCWSYKELEKDYTEPSARQGVQIERLLRQNNRWPEGYF